MKSLTDFQGKDVSIRMRTGENIFKRRDGRWEARYRKGRDSSGRIVYGYCYGRTYTEAKQKMEASKASYMQTGPVPAASKEWTLGYYADAWLRQNRLRLRDSTYVKYMGFLDNHIIPYLGDIPPTGVTAQTVASFSSYLLNTKGLSPKTAKDILVVLNSILRFIEKQLPNQVGQIDFVYPTQEKSEIRVLSVEEQQALTNYLLTDTDSCKFGVLLSLLTGLRIGELCALRWDHVFLDRKLLRVDASMQRLKNLDPNGASKTVVVIGAPKSQASRRTIPLPDSIVSLSRRFCPADRGSFVLTGTEQYMEPRTLQRRFAKYAKDCGLEHVTVHTCRHTFATRCIEAGFELKSLSEIMGHANTSITMNRYVHCSMELKRKNMDMVRWPGIA
ncbi:MAG: tyrosine-type recombinase/integrase [Clostridiales bacterium]|nr:tyrosine-type recombinase/integrase [Clostridiales bacterium]